MRHIGDGDDQAEAVAVRLAIHRVVEILGVLAVDGDQRQCAQVDAAGDVGGCTCSGTAVGFGEHFGREFVRDVVAVDRGFDHLRWRELVAEHGQILPIGGRCANPPAW
jgi:hypothetical protein